MLNPVLWLQLPIELRVKFARKFDLKRSSFTHVVDNKVETDGYTASDLMGITIDKMQFHLESTETDFFKLFNSMIREFTKEIEDDVKELEQQKTLVKEVLVATNPSETQIPDHVSRPVGRPRGTTKLTTEQQIPYVHNGETGSLNTGASSGEGEVKGGDQPQAPKGEAGALPVPQAGVQISGGRKDAAPSNSDGNQGKVGIASTHAQAIGA